MDTPAGYTINEIIHDRGKTIVYRGINHQQQQPVVIKILNIEFPTLKEIARCNQEYKILSQLNSPGIVKV